MHKFIAILVVLIIAANATATNNVQRYFIKHGSTLAYSNPTAYAAPAQVPTSYRFDVRLNPHKYGYVPQVPAYPYPPQYVLPQTVPVYAPAVPAPVPAHHLSYPSPSVVQAPLPPSASAHHLSAPAHPAYIPPHVLAHLQVQNTRQFIGRHFPNPYHH